EKFGTWPDTKRHVYDDGWLRRFFDALRENQSWLRTATLAEAVDSNDATGKIYLPEGSYREMTEWALPYEKQHAYEDLRHEFHDDPRWDRVQQFVRGGFWRNFKVRYPDTDDMYTRMLMVSQRIEQASQHGLSDHQLDDARRELYRGQCNCSYWHGAFGGAYLPHLRHAVYNHLIAAENLVDEAFGKQGTWIESYANDFNLDGLAEVRLANDQLICLLAPHQGGHIYELDVRPICLNLSASLDRHPEAYHRKVLAGPSDNEGQVSSIHDRVVFKQAGLDQRVQYDTYRRKSLIDHFYGENQGLEAVAAGQAQELGSFVEAPFQAVVRRNPDRCQVKLTHDGHVGDVPVRITKGVTLEAGSDTLEIAYLLDGVPNDQPLHFGVEFNFAGLPGGADDRYFATGDGSHLGNLSQRLELSDIDQLDLIDEWQGIGLRLTANRPTHFWTFPLESVSQSEGGFELVQQSVVVMPRWYVLGDMDGRWSVTMSLKLDTSVAMSRRMEQLLAATS
ncbi:MAG: DUF1926 domain-containing protein, partial [Planctomycetales bacterium]|nr:DUF1926 domain-containing protein [Planctomycetales bacterium]